MAAVLVLLSLSLAANPDRVVELPHLDHQPSFAQYSGYVAVNDENSSDDTRFLHYYFVESQNDPQNDPVVLWMNGGPGCSSMLGFLTEHGPFRFNANGTELHANPYSWNKVASMVYLEQPSPVGYSYGGNLTSGDDLAAHDNWRFVVGFLEKYPHLKTLDLYISGESYAGQYVPQLANKIQVENEAGRSDINLKGFIVGNPSGLSSSEWEFSSTMFMRNHALISDAEVDVIAKACNKSEGRDSTSKACDEAQQAAYERNFKGIDPYNILAPCVGDGPSENPGCAVQQSDEGALFALKNKASLSQTFIPCGDYNDVIKYLNLPEVMAALHVSASAFPWTPCSQHLKYDQYRPGTPELYKKMKDTLRIAVYSGDIDSCVPYLGTQRGVKNLGLKVVEPFRRWMYNDTSLRDHTSQIAGYTEHYAGVAYITVRGAGHMVPTDAPAQALYMFSSFLANTPL